jgi:hypothetical protein
MIKSAFQIPHHIAIGFLFFVPPRRKLSQNIGAGDDGLSQSAEKG